MRLDDGLKRNISVSVEPLSTNKGDRRILLVLLKNISDTDRQADDGADIAVISDDDERRILNRRIQELESDLRLTEESLQYVTERLEANTEQLQASNEELQASNEELQASNEELQASNEELQAVNEELLSVSAEHEAQLEFISEIRQDHESVLRLLTAAVLILDEELRIIRFTEVVGHILGLEQHDLGRSIETVGARPDFANISEMVGQALSSNENIEASGHFENADTTIKVYAQDFLKPEKSTRIFVILTGDLVKSKSVSVPRSSWSDG
ncbi:MAG: PAS domain-containing protein [Marivivens sp.]|nr:PAS domain-containing protein [Marivivens sp.]